MADTRPKASLDDLMRYGHAVPSLERLHGGRREGGCNECRGVCKAPGNDSARLYEMLHSVPRTS